MAHFQEIDNDYDHLLENDCDLEICEEENFVELAPNIITGIEEYQPKIGNTLENIGKMILTNR